MNSDIILQVQFEVYPNQIPEVENTLRVLNNDTFSYYINELAHQLYMKVQTDSEATLAQALQTVGPAIASLEGSTQRVSLIAVGTVPTALQTALEPFEPKYISLQEYQDKYQGMMQ